MAVVIALNIAYGKLESAIEALVNRPEITWISATTGLFDVVALARFSSTDSLSDFLTKQLGHMEGVKDSQTLTCFDVKKGRYIPLT